MPRLLPTLLSAIALLLAGCQPQRPPEPVLETTAWPPFDYSEAQVRGLPVYAVDAATSRLEVIVGREGPLARLGHDHVIAADKLSGFLLLPTAPGEARADLRFAVADLSVDAAGPRSRQGLGPPPDDAAVTGTRENLLTHVLDPARWPWVDIALSNFTIERGQAFADLDIAINGGRYATRKAFALRIADQTVVAQGRVELSQRNLGLQPYSVMGGGLRVADKLAVDFRLSGRLLH